VYDNQLARLPALPVLDANRAMAHAGGAGVNGS
jgi:hypothetical protein